MILACDEDDASWLPIIRGSPGKANRAETQRSDLVEGLYLPVSLLQKKLEEAERDRDVGASLLAYCPDEHVVQNMVGWMDGCLKHLSLVKCQTFCHIHFIQ